MKKYLAIALVMALVLTVLAGCGNNKGGSSDGPMYISVVSKGFQHQFWQAVKAGSDQAAIDLGVEVYFTGPEGESAVADQVAMIDAELAKNPAAMALAALDTSSVLSQLADAQSRGIPIIGFDSGVPQAPAGQIAANAKTDSIAAAALGADYLFKALENQISAATSDSPVVIAVFSQDVTSGSISERTKGFAERMANLAEGVNSNGVAISGGYGAINKGDAGGAAVIIEVIVGATPEITDMTNAANGLLNISNLTGIFCSNEGAVAGLLAAINAGSIVPEGVQIVGFDSGSAQKGAVRSGQFLGSITQDPYQIGYKAVELAVKAAKGESVSDADTGAKWYDADNIDDPDIAILVYDG